MEASEKNSAVKKYDVELHTAIDQEAEKLF
jgi:hypothetical protein